MKTWDYSFFFSLLQKIIQKFVFSLQITRPPDICATWLIWQRHLSMFPVTGYQATWNKFIYVLVCHNIDFSAPLSVSESRPSWVDANPLRTLHSSSLSQLFLSVSTPLSPSPLSVCLQKQHTEKVAARQSIHRHLFLLLLLLVLCAQGIFWFLILFIQEAWDERLD